MSDRILLAARPKRFFFTGPIITGVLLGGLALLMQSSWFALAQTARAGRYFLEIISWRHRGDLWDGDVYPIRDDPHVSAPLDRVREREIARYANLTLKLTVC